MPMTPLHTKNNYIKITLKRFAYKSENILMSSFYTKKNNRVKKAYLQNLHPKHTHKPLFLLKITFKSNNSHKKSSNTNNSQSLTNKHKVKYITNACIPIIIIKKF